MIICVGTVLQFSIVICNNKPVQTVVISSMLCRYPIHLMAISADKLRFGCLGLIFIVIREILIEHTVFRLEIQYRPVLLKTRNPTGKRSKPIVTRAIA